MIQIKKCIVILLVCFGQIEAHALIRYVKPGSAGSAPYLSWATASNDLQAVINASSSGDQIWVAAGTYKPNRRADATGTITANDRFNAFVLKSGVKIYGGFTGIELTLAARDYVANVTFLSGDIGTTILTTDNCYHVVVSAGAVGTAELNGFTITRGNANGVTDITVNGQAIISDYGGGLQAVSSSPIISNCIFTNNLSSAFGGAMYNNSSSPTLFNCVFTSNLADGGSGDAAGGGIYNISSSSPTLSNCSFSNNSVVGAGARGGGIFNTNSSSPTLSNCSFSNNSAVSIGGYGGGIFNINSSSPTISNCSFINNSASVSGGGILSSNSPLVITNTTFVGNLASNGGGMYMANSTSSIENCSFTSNSASNNGGGVFIDVASPSMITNVIFTGNSANAGGGLYYNSSGTTNITNISLAANKASTGGGGIYVNSGSPAIRNSIVWGNKVGVTVSSITGTATVTYCDIEGGYAGTGNINAVPLFINPQPASSAPTSTGDYRLQRCSPALDAGSNAAIPGGITTDLDGNPRIFNTTVDMGAYEKQYALPDANGIVYVDKTKTGDGKTWANAVAELADALKAAKSNTGITEIWVAKGTYYPLYDAATLGCNPTDNRDKSFVLVNNVKLYGGFAGGETDTSGRDFVTNETKLSGDFYNNDIIIGSGHSLSITYNTENAYHVAISAGAVGTARLDGFTLQRGNANTVTGIIVNAQNVFRNLGGGLHSNSSSPTIANTIFRNNFGFGVLYNLNSASTISNCSFTINSGSGICNASSSPIITNTIFTGNLAVNGGGIYNVPSSSPTLINCIFTGNSATWGGGVFNNFSSSPILTNCIFTGNSAINYGGGMYTQTSSSPIISNTIFTGNYASWGGGIFSTAGSFPNIINSTIAGNYAATNGGGIFGNSAPVMKNSIVWGNKSGTLINNIAGTATVTYSDIEGGYTGTGNINVDPQFINPQPASAAPTILGDYRLHPCSPAINVGNNADIPVGITTDLDGNSRIVNTTVDMGAYEVQAGATVTVTPSGAGIVFVDSSAYGNGSSWATPTHNLADALKAAKTNTAITEIWVKKGTYYPIYDAATLGCNPTDNRDKSFVLVNNVKLYGGFAGGETDTSGRDFVTNETKLSGDFNNDDVITGNGATLSITNNVENSYHVAISAGAVGTARLDGFTVQSGNASAGTNISVNAQTINRGSGSGLSNKFSSVVVANCSFTANYSYDGSGIYNESSSSIILDCTFKRNASFGEGGGINNYYSSPIIKNCIFIGNAASSGGISNIYSSSIITNCIFSGNSAYAGGGIYNYISSPTISNCSFIGNKAYYGGGISNVGLLPTIINCSIAGNTAITDGGGIYNNSTTPVIKNSIIWGNKVGAVVSNIFGTATVSYSNIEGGFTGTGNIDADPLFINPQPASSAPTILGDYRLQACSPAINVGNNADIPVGITTDLDNNPRIVYTTVDMGAYEQQSNTYIDGNTADWKGVNTNWNDMINWCGNKIPVATTNVTVPATSNNPIVGAAATNEVKNIVLSNGTSLGTNATGKLTINGTYTNNGSSIANNGTLVFAGSAASQSFPGASGTITAMNNLEIKNSNGITLDKSFAITGSLIPTAGNININNAIITLRSTVNGTASVTAIQPGASLSYTGTGEFMVERFINTGTNTGEHAKTWQFLATPTTGQTIRQAWQENGTTPAGFGTIITGTGTGFDITTVLPSLKFFNDAAVNWTAVTNTNTALQNKLGYMLFVRGDRTVTTSNGTPNNTTLKSKGTLFQPSNPPPPVAVAANKFQTFGNPYASRIEFSKVRAASTGINDVFYVWDPKLAGNYNVGGYQTITGLAGYIPTVGTPPTGNPATDFYPAGVPSPYIESGQAVFVKGNGTGGNVNFNETVKASGSRLVNRPGTTNNELANRAFIFASLFTHTGIIADGNIVAFEEGLGNELNELDALKIMNSGENFGIIRSDSLLAVEARNQVMSNDTIFYHLQNLKQLTYQFRFAPVNMRSGGLHAYLIDRFNNSSTEVSMTDSSFINFTITEDVRSQAADRFILVFKKQKQGPVKPKTPKEAQELARNTDASDDETIQTNASITVYPNPVVDQQINIRFSNMSKGNYRIELSNKQGQVVYEGNIYIDRYNTTKTIKLNSLLASGSYQLSVTAEDGKKMVNSIILK